MRGRWAAGISPRNFAWIVQDRLAVSERPGGYAPHHRRVRRQEEILWLRGNGFTRVVSLLPSQHNLHAYEELGLAHAHFPVPAQADARDALLELYRALLGWLRSGEHVLVHQEELGDRLAGVMAGFLCWSGALPEPPRAVSAVERLVRRQMGTAGRSLAVLAAELPPPDPAPEAHGGLGLDLGEAPAASADHPAGAELRTARTDAPPLSAVPDADPAPEDAPVARPPRRRTTRPRT